MVPWLKIHLPTQETQVGSLVREDYTCHGANNLCTTTIDPVLECPRAINYRAHLQQLLKPEHLEPVPCNKRSHHNEMPIYISKTQHN